MLQMTDAAFLTDLSEEVRQTMQVLGDVMNSVYYVYGAVFRELEKLHEANAGDVLADSVYFLLCDLSYHVRHKRKFEK